MLDIKKVYFYYVTMNMQKIKKIDTRRSILIEKELHEQMKDTAKQQETSLVGLIRYLYENYGRNLPS
tara:strand:+ start:275 stop:475 length:201 start_codon:yes stop_codon:yes gene_type:complete